MTIIETGSATESPSETNRGRRRLLMFLKISTVLLLVGALIGTAYTELSTSFPGGPSREAVLRAEAVYLALVAVPSIWLLILAIRPVTRANGSRGPSASGIVIGAVCLALGLLFIGPPLLLASTGEIRDAIMRTQQPTAAETAYTPAELAAAADSFVADAAAEVGATAYSRPGLTTDEESCRVSNLDPGVSYRSTGYLFTTSADEEDILSTLAATWESDGYTTESYPRGPDIERPFVRAVGGIMTTAEATIVGADDYNLVISFETVCVVE